MLATLDPAALLDRMLVPARRADEGRDAGRGGAAPASPSPAGPTARRRASSPAATTATFLGRHGLASRAEASDRRRVGTGARPPRRLLALHAGPAPRPRRRGRGAAVRAAHRPGRNAVVVGPRAALAATRVAASGRLYASAACRSRAKLRAPLAAVGAARSSPPPAASGSTLDEPVYGVARGQTAVLYDDDAVVGAGASGRVIQRRPRAESSRCARDTLS